MDGWMDGWVDGGKRERERKREKEGEISLPHDLAHFSRSDSKALINH